MCWPGVRAFPFTRVNLPVSKPGLKNRVPIVLGAGGRLPACDLPTSSGMLYGVISHCPCIASSRSVGVSGHMRGQTTTLPLM